MMKRSQGKFNGDDEAEIAASSAPTASEQMLADLRKPHSRVACATKTGRRVIVIVLLLAALQGAAADCFGHDAGAHVCRENDPGRAAGGPRPVRH